MESSNREKYFGAADFVAFFASLILSALIGVYFGYKDKNKNSIETYYYGDRNVSPFAVAMSMAVSFVSAITVLGYPVETYYYGIAFLWMVVATLLGACLAAIYFVPLIYRLQLKSMYEYLELRYNKYIRRLCCGLFMLHMILYMGNTVYLPALALNSVTPLDLEWSIAVTSLICTFYTTLGGIKAVIWTDVLQSFIMVFGALALFIRATLDVGGIEVVFDSANRGGRLNFFKLDSDIRIRSSASKYFLDRLILSINGICFSQVFAQRFLSCKSVSTARKAAITHVLPVTVFMLLAAADGLAMYAYYEGCDPYEAGIVTKRDQLAPRFVIDVFGTLPGLAGIFVAAAYSGALSTVSSGINSLAAVTTEDFIDPFWPELSASRKSLLAKMFTIIYGFLVTCVAYSVSQLQSTVVQISVSLAGIVNGPITGVFLLGTMCPWVNAKGVIGGIMLGSLFSAWCSVGSIIHGASPEFIQMLPVSVEECYDVNATSSTYSYRVANTSTASYTPTTQTFPYRSVLDDTLYSISPFLYGVFGFIIGSVSMIIISGITGFNKPREMNPKVFVPIIDNERIFSKRIVKFFRFGVPEIAEKELVTEMIPFQGDVNINRA